MNAKLDYKIYTNNIDNVLAYGEGTIFYVSISISDSYANPCEGWLCRGDGNKIVQLLKIIAFSDYQVRKDIINYFFDEVYNEATMAINYNPFEEEEELSTVPIEDHNALKSITMRLLDTLTSVISKKGIDNLDLVALIALLNECKTLDLDLVTEQGV